MNGCFRMGDDFIDNTIGLSMKAGNFPAGTSHAQATDFYLCSIQLLLQSQVAFPGSLNRVAIGAEVFCSQNFQVGNP